MLKRITVAGMATVAIARARRDSSPGRRPSLAGWPSSPLHARSRPSCSSSPASRSARPRRSSPPTAARSPAACRSSTASPCKLPAKQAAKLAAERQVIGLTLNSRVHGTAVEDGALAATLPEDDQRRQGLASRLHRQGRRRRRHRHRHRRRRRRLQGRARATRASSPTRSRPRAATTAGDGFGHGTHVAGIIAGNSLNRPRERPAARQVHRRRAGREPDRGQGLRRGRQLDRPGRHQRHPVRRRPQGRVQHPRPEPVGQLRHPAVLQARPAGRGRRVRVAEGHRRRRRLGQPRRRPRRRQVLARATTRS